MTTYQITADELRKILIGVEHSGNTNTIYTVGFSVADYQLGKTGYKNSSGFSFGFSQLGIGNNDYAQAFYSYV